jgi:hypothetical protein
MKSQRVATNEMIETDFLTTFQEKIVPTLNGICVSKGCLVSLALFLANSCDAHIKRLNKNSKNHQREK